MIREIHGVAGVKKRNPSDGDTMGVRVIDGKEGVELVFGSCTVFVELTPEQACFLANQLRASATRIEKAAKP